MWFLYNETSTVQCTRTMYTVRCTMYIVKWKLRCRVQRDHTYLCVHEQGVLTVQLYVQYTVKVPYFASRPNFATFGLFVTTVH